MNRILVFGCGNIAKETYKYISKKNNKILYYLDNDPAKQGGVIFGKKIISPDDIVNLEYDYILIASSYWREMRQQLLEIGVDSKRIKCPLAPMNMKKFKTEYKELYNIWGKIKFFYGKWYLTEQFKPDRMGIFVNPYFFSRKRLYEIVSNYSHYMTGKCMDFGCGIQPYRKLFSVDEYIGVEIETENKRKGITYYDGYKLPFADEEFDSVISSEVFEHVVNIEDIVIELNRVLKPGGTMLVTAPFVYPKHCEPYDYKRYTLRGLENLLCNAGFECVESKTGSTYWEVIAQLKNVYWAEEIKTKTTIGWVAKKIIIISNTLMGIFASRILPNTEKMYLDNAVIVKKKAL